MRVWNDNHEPAH